MSHSTYQMPTEAKIKQWKKEHGSLHKITPDPSRPAIFCIVRHPKLNDIVSSSQVGGSDELKIGVCQLNDCWLDGDARIKTDAELQKSAALKMGTLFETYESKLEYISVTEAILKDVPADKLERVKADGEVRRLTVFVETFAEKLARLNAIENNKTDSVVSEVKDPVQLVAILMKPNFEDLEKADTANDPIARGTIFLQECWISGDEALLKGTDEIRFSAYLASLRLFRTFTSAVEKL